MTSVFSIDVEDWFHILDIPNAPTLDTWASLPSRVESSFLTLLDLADEYGVTCTCFFLGWVGERFPQLVKTAHQRGHEIGSHSYAHRLVYKMTPQQFRTDARHSRELLEDISGNAVNGFRAPGFSVIEDTPWFFEELANAGYKYDSSIFPGRRYSGGCPAAPAAPHRIKAGPGTHINEFPSTVLKIGTCPISFFGGGYLRISAWPLIRIGAKAVAARERPVIFYVHPREIDPGHPRLPMNLIRRFKTYTNVRTTRDKLRHIFREFAPKSFRDHFPDLCTSPRALITNKTAGASL
jgi:polysaccharide deacetylase family protein (PEP-CTERM system associated)